MRTSIYFIVMVICFGTMLYYFVSDWTVLHPWLMNLSLFFIGEFAFALCMGKMIKNSREYHEKFIWMEEDNPEI